MDQNEHRLEQEARKEMTIFLTVLTIYVMIGLVLTKATLWYTLMQVNDLSRIRFLVYWFALLIVNDLSRIRFLVYWFALLIIGQLWLPILSIVLYHSRKKPL